jgi:hypothetical protein
MKTFWFSSSHIVQHLHVTFGLDEFLLSNYI